MSSRLEVLGFTVLRAPWVLGFQSLGDMRRCMIQGQGSKRYRHAPHSVIRVIVCPGPLSFESYHKYICIYIYMYIGHVEIMLRLCSCSGYLALTWENTGALSS